MTIIDYFCVAIASGIGGFVGAYLKQKGENLATKQDIGAITTAVGEVEHSFERKLESLRQEKELKVAIASRRIEAHQEAYVLWWEMIRHVHQKNCQDYAYKCQEWWVKNCLYLESGASNAFREAYMACSLHTDILKIRDSNAAEENWQKIKHAELALKNGIHISSFGETTQILQKSGDVITIGEISIEK